MKITTKQEDKIEYGAGLEEASDFTLKASAQAFVILSSGLYSDKEMAIVREITANAHDAVQERKRIINNPAKLKEKGIQKKWLEQDATVTYVVELPNILKPELVIKDYGIGLSEKAIKEIYTSYFESTKDGENDSIGGFGLGSKSPFSYVESFTVESRFNGIKYVYSAMVGEGGVPKLQKFGETTTKEKNGLTIKVPVKEDGFNIFKRKLIDLMARFEERPVITGIEDDEYIDAEYALKGDDWGIRTKTFSRAMYGSNNNNGYVVMGGIAYKLDEAILRNLIPTAEHKYLDVMTENGIDFFLPIGSVSLSPQREGLSYDKKTVDFLRKTFINTANDVVEKLKELIDNSSSDLNVLQNTLRKVGDMLEKSSETKELIWTGIEEYLHTFLTEKHKGIKSPVNGMWFSYDFKNLGFNNFAITVPFLAEKTFKRGTTKKQKRDFFHDIFKEFCVTPLNSYAYKKEKHTYRKDFISANARVVNFDMWRFSMQSEHSVDIDKMYGNNVIVVKGNAKQYTKKTEQVYHALKAYMKSDKKEEDLKNLKKDVGTTADLRNVDNLTNYTKMFVVNNFTNTYSFLRKLRTSMLKDVVWVFLDDVELPETIKSSGSRKKTKAQIMEISDTGYQRFVDVDDLELTYPKGTLVFETSYQNPVDTKLYEEIKMFKAFSINYDTYVRKVSNTLPEIIGVPATRMREVDWSHFKKLDNSIITKYAKTKLKTDWLEKHIIVEYLENGGKHDVLWEDAKVSSTAKYSVMASLASYESSFAATDLYLEFKRLSEIHTEYRKYADILDYRKKAFINKLLYEHHVDYKNKIIRDYEKSRKFGNNFFKTKTSMFYENFARCSENNVRDSVRKEFYKDLLDYLTQRL